jgi:hypothetical protein
LVKPVLALTKRLVGTLAAKRDGDACAQALEIVEKFGREAIRPVVVDLQQADDLVADPQGNERDRFVAHAVATIAIANLGLLLCGQGQ